MIAPDPRCRTTLTVLLRDGLAGVHPADFVAGWSQLAAAELEASGWADGCPGADGQRPA
ncbi:MAG TPA: hypothetical protein VFH36_04865 [Acidimicrobiales bacterium]|nr:hypothetical protein [Acidimicrobiales bacterium]